MYASFLASLFPCPPTPPPSQTLPIDINGDGVRRVGLGRGEGGSGEGGRTDGVPAACFCTLSRLMVVGAVAGARIKAWRFSVCVWGGGRFSKARVRDLRQVYFGPWSGRWGSKCLAGLTGISTNPGGQGLHSLKGNGRLPALPRAPRRSVARTGQDVAAACPAGRILNRQRRLELWRLYAWSVISSDSSGSEKERKRGSRARS